MRKQPNLYYAVAALAAVVWAFLWIALVLQRREMPPLVNSAILAFISGSMGRGKVDQYLKEEQNGPPDEPPDNG